MTHYTTIDIAREAGIHVNTVRLYEEIGLISVAPRAANGYRIFSEKHLYQTKIARLIVHGIWPGKPIRNSGMKVVIAMKEWGQLNHALDNLSRAFAYRIKIGRMDLNYAKYVMKLWLYDNPKRIYNL